MRSLRAAPEQVYIVGTDMNAHTLMRAETDARHLVPAVDDPAYLHVIRQIVSEEGIDFVHAQNDAELAFLSDHRDELGTMTFLPARETVALCQDKFASYVRWRAAGLRVPETMLIEHERDLRDAFAGFGGRVWLRATGGAGGRGSLATDDLATATSWIEFNRGWGEFTAAKLLEPDSVTWMSIWHHGELVVAQARLRLYWELARISPSGITGVTGAGLTVRDPKLDDVALAAVAAIDARPHGLFGVDLTYDADGIANPTEINIGRFFTTHHFFTVLGLNMPWIFVQLAFGEDSPQIEAQLSPLPPGMVWIRGVDFEPVLVHESELAGFRAELERRCAMLGFA